jgi:hypothetical protein
MQNAIERLQLWDTHVAPLYWHETFDAFVPVLCQYNGAIIAYLTEICEPALAELKGWL